MKKCRTDLDVENEILTKDSSKNETEVFIKQTSTYGIVSENTSKIEKIENQNKTYDDEVSMIWYTLQIFTDETLRKGCGF